MNAKGRLAFLDADIEKAGETVYPEFHAYFSKDGIRDLRPVHHGLFEPEDEIIQLGHGMSPLDGTGWSRDGVI